MLYRVLSGSKDDTGDSLLLLVISIKMLPSEQRFLLLLGSSSDPKRSLLLDAVSANAPHPTLKIIAPKPHFLIDM